MVDHQRSLFDVVADESVPAGTAIVVQGRKEVGRIVGLDPEQEKERERAAAIAYLKREVESHLLWRAKLRVHWPAKDAGVTAEDFRALAERYPQHVLVGSKPRSWSWVGPHLAALARAGKLAAFFVEGIPVKRCAKREASHGNDHRVYLHPDDPRATGGPRSQLAEA